MKPVKLTEVKEDRLYSEEVRLGERGTYALEQRMFGLDCIYFRDALRQDLLRAVLAQRQVRVAVRLLVRENAGVS